MEMDLIPNKECLFCKEPLEGSPVPFGGKAGDEVLTVIKTLLNLQSKCEDGDGCDHPVCKLESLLEKKGVEDVAEGGAQEDGEGTHVRCEGNRLIPFCERCSKVIHDILGLQTVVEGNQNKQRQLLGNLNLPSHSKPMIFSPKDDDHEEVGESVGTVTADNVDTEDLQMSLVAVKNKLEKQRSAFRSLQRENDNLKAWYIFEPEFAVVGESKSSQKQQIEQKYWVKEMEALEQTLAGLKLKLIKIQEENVSKDEEARKLGRRVAEMRKASIAEPVGGSMSPFGHPSEENAQISRTGNAMVWNEPRHAIVVFPEEIWKMILDNLTEVEDFVNCSKACRLFYRILKPTGTTWMFKQVFPVLWKYLPGEEILSSRAVCKSWAGAVDHFFDNHISRRPHSNEESDPRNLSFVHPMTEKKLGEQYFIPDKDNTEVMDTFDFHVFAVGKLVKDHAQSRSPIIGRGFKIIEHYDDGWENEKIFWEYDVPKLLDLYGKHIWYLTICLRRARYVSRMEPKFILEFLTVDIFRLVPNLRKLSICCDERRNDYVFDERILENLPSVNAPYLETLQLECLGSTDILEILLGNYHNQLQRLHLKEEQWIDICLNEWPELKELHLEKMYHSRFSSENFKSLFEMYTPKLNKLGLGLHCCDDLTMDEILKVINWLSSTCPLNSVRLSGAFPLHAGKNMRTNLYAPSKLKTLEVEHFIEPDITQFRRFTYDFLLRFPFLQNVHLYCRKKQGYDEDDDYEDYDPHYEGGRRGSEVALLPEKKYQDFVGCYHEAHKMDKDAIVKVNPYLYYHEMYDSNVWEMLPRLKVFTFNHRMYTREGYEAYQDRIDNLPYNERMENRLRRMSMYDRPHHPHRFQTGIGVGPIGPASE